MKKQIPINKRSQPSEFLAKAQTDRKLSDQVLAAVERGGKVTADEVLKIAKKAGYSFTRSEFEKEVKRSYAERFAAGDKGLTDVAAKPRPRPRPPLSSCARGCLSYTKSWHPSNFRLG